MAEPTGFAKGLKMRWGYFPGGSVVKTPCFHCRGHGFNPWSGTKIPHATAWLKKKKMRWERKGGFRDDPKVFDFSSWMAGDKGNYRRTRNLIMDMFSLQSL